MNAPPRVESFRLKRPAEIDKMRVAGRILGACLTQVAAAVRPGVTTLDLDHVAETFIRDHGAIPGFIGYDGFPSSICISVNEEVVHGIPGPRVVQEGDLVSLDCGLILDGWWADSGYSVPCGEASPEVLRLIEVTSEALERGIAAARPGNHIGDIGHAVQTYAEAQGFSVVRQFVGHGIGRDMHEPPQVPNYGRPGTGNLLKPGYVLAIEPMVNAGRAEVHILDDQWTVVTDDHRLSSYAEHTVAITEHGPEVLTVRPGAVIAAGAA
ncbi:MAG TPA: type I methionyl aminopeptidase [Candidatus Dormibacteraeota bacterium]